MPIILVVDDTEVDRQLIGGLIRKDIEWIVEYAENGQAALDLMEHTSPDVVVTDLVMPEMDGIELVRRAKKSYPQIPVILATGQGSEEDAVRALKAGAASYVPKSALADSLMDTIDQVLHLANEDEPQDRLMHCLTHTRYQFKMPNDPALIQPLIIVVTSLMQQLGMGDEAIRRHVAVALEEALLNGMLHGNLELLPFQVQQARHELHENGSSDVVATRMQESPYKDRHIVFGADVKPQKVQFIVRDHGKGFDTSKLPTREALDQLSSAEGGRGLMLIGNFMDEVGFNESGTEIQMALKSKA